MIDIDTLAEAYYADRDPAFQDDEELEAQREKEEERILGFVTNRIRDIFNELNANELRICLENVDSVNEYLFETLEDMVCMI